MGLRMPAQFSFGAQLMIHNASRALVLSLLSVQLIVTAQTGVDKSSATQEKALKLRTEEVIIDAVVLDKKNRSVLDLTAADFEIYEDGVKQKISSFRFESTSTTSQASAKRAVPIAANCAAVRSASCRGVRPSPAAVRCIFWPCSSIPVTNKTSNPSSRLKRAIASVAIRS